MRNPLKDYFHFTRSERNGIIVLLILSFVAFLVPRIYSHFHKPEPVDFSEMDAAVEMMQLNQKKQSDFHKKTEITNPFPFDPNKADKNTLIQLGFSPKVVQTILNYRQKGGQFFKKSDFKKIYGITPEDYEVLQDFIQISNIGVSKYASKKKISKPKATKQLSKVGESDLFDFNPNTASKEDLQKLGLTDKVIRTVMNFRKRGSFRKSTDFSVIYGLSDEDFQLLKPFIQIPPKESYYNKKPLASDAPKYQAKAKLTSSPTPSPLEEVKIDINQSTKKDWQKLSGIGPYFAKKVISYRDKLGGFATIEQIADTYELPDSIYQKIIPQLIVSPVLKTININSIKAKDLQDHPYFSWKQANTIINYRTQHGDFKNEKDLSKILSFKEDYIKKISPYLEY